MEKADSEPHLLLLRQILKMPFGLRKLPPIFQRFINDIFIENVKQDILFVQSVDDLKILAKNEEVRNGVKDC